jgi:hypothetical protein
VEKDLFDFWGKNNEREVTGWNPEYRDENDISNWGGPLQRLMMQAIYTISFLCLLRFDEVLKVQHHHTYRDHRYGSVPHQADPSIPKNTPKLGNQAFRPLAEYEKAAPRSGPCSLEVDRLFEYQVGRCEAGWGVSPQEKAWR